MPNDDEVLYDPGTTPQAKASDDKGEVIYDPAAASTAPRSDPQQITAPKASDFVPDSQTIPNLAKGAGEGTIDMGKGIVNTIAHPIDALTGLGHTVADTYQSTRGDIKGGTPGQIPLDIATGAARIAGFDEPHLAQEWNQGKGAEAVGEAAPMAIADAVAAEKATGHGNLEVNGKPAIQSADNYAASKLREPATQAQSLRGKPGTIKPILPSILQKYVIPDWLVPKGEIGTPTNPGPMREFMGRNAIAPPSTPGLPGIAGPEGEGPIGSNPFERQAQTIMQKSIVSPEEQATAERILGPDALMRPGEGLAKWRSRVTGTLKAARARTE